MKRCAKCHEAKPPSDFYANVRWRDGLHPYCKSCLLAHQKTRREIKRATEPGKYRWKRDLIRHDYFGVMDSPKKAYVLGLLAADGNVLPKHHRITLELAAKDADLLSMIRDELVPGGAITTRERHGRTYHLLAFVSRQMIADLASFGVVAAKSRIIAWPEQLPAQYVRAFILGYFDGDGHVTWHDRPNGRYPYLGITGGSPAMLEEIARRITAATGATVGGPWKKTPATYLIRASGESALAVDRWLHQDDLGLARKRLAAR